MSAAQPQISATVSYGWMRPAPRLWVFSRQTSCVPTQVIVAGGPDAVHQLFDLQHAVVAFDRLGGDAEELGVRALLVADDVAVGFAEEFVAGLAVNAHAELVAHRAGGDEERGFFAEHAGDSLFEAADGGVFAENIVADFGGGHGGAHAGGGASYGVAAEVDRRLHLGFSFRWFLARMRIAAKYYRVLL